MVPKGNGGTEHHRRPVTITWGCYVGHPSRVQRGRVLWGLSGYGRWSGSRGMPPRLEDEDHYEPKDEEQEKEDALPPASILLVPVRMHEPKRERGRMRSNFNRYQTRTREDTNRVAISSSLTASFMWTAVCSILYSTLSRSVPWSMTSDDKSLKSSARVAIDFAISVSSRSRARRSGSRSCWSTS